MNRVDQRPNSSPPIGILFAEAMCLPDDEREAFLSEVCGDDAELRRQIDLMIEDAESVDQQLGSIGGYELAGEIARGGMGIVYRAHQVRLDRPVALKLIREATLASAEERARFQIEAEAAAGIEHPNLVPIYEIGEDDGLLFYSMKLIEGGTLAAPPESWNRDRRHTIRAMAKVGRALQAVHESGVLHRDLKPGNVLIDEEGEPHLTDFGLARRMDSETMLTLSGQVLGTPNYMSPEQARGEKLTTASDVYGFGAILHQALTGKPPFSGESTVETLRLVAEEPPKHPDLGDRDLETIVMKCLEKAPADRYRSAAAAADDLERWANSETISARPATRTERLQKWVRRNPTLAAFWATAVLLVLTLAIGGPLWALNQRRLNEEIATESEQRRQELYVSQMNQAGESLAQLSGRKLIAPLLENWAGDDAIDIRGWEWGYLQGISEAKRSTILRQAYMMHSIAVTPNKGKVVLDRISASGFKFLLLHPDSNKVISAFPKNPDPKEVEFGTNFLAFAPSGMRLLERPVNGPIMIYSGEAGEKTHEFASTGSASTSIEWSQDGKQILETTTSGVLRVLDSFTGEVSFTKQYPGRIKGLWDPQDARRIAVQESNGKVRIHSLDDWDRPISLDNPSVFSGLRGGLNHMDWSPDGKRIVVTGQNDTVDVWNVENQKKVKSITNFRLRKPYRFDPSSRFLAVCSEGTILIYHVETGVLIDQLIGHASYINQLHWSPDGQSLYSAGNDHTVRKWRPVLREPPSYRIRSLAASPTSDLVLGCTNAYIFRIDTEAPWRPERFAINERRLPTRPAWSADGSLVATDGLTIRSPESGEIIDDSIRIHAFKPVWSPDSRYLATGSRAPEGWFLEVHDLAERRVIYRSGLGSAGMCGWVWNEDGSNLYVRGYHFLSRLSVGKDGAEVELSRDKGVNSRCIDLSPDQTLLACGANEKIELIDPASLEVVDELAGHANRVYGLQWSPDGSRLASFGMTGPILLWDVEKRVKVCPIYLDGGVHCVDLDWSHDGQSLIVADSKGIIHVLNGGTEPSH